MTVTEDLDRSVKLTAEGKWNEARKLLTRLARKGVREAQFNLGLIYANGYDLKPDYAKAIKWYSKAAEQDMPEAQVNLGAFYFDGTGVAKDLGKAFELFQKAADSGYALAQLHVGMMYESGLHVAKDLGIQNYSNMDKATLVEVILAY